MTKNTKTKLLETQQQYDEVVAKYKDTALWMKAPNGQPTNLTEEQWVLVRTPNFKNWFGDWEKYYNVLALIEEEPVDISFDKTILENAKDVYKAIKKAKNKYTKDEVIFVNSIFGKLTRHKNYDPRLIGELKSLFENAVYLGSENPDFETPRKDGTSHKKQNNIEKFSYYLNKIKMDNNNYLIRYTVQDLKHKEWKKQEHNFHSQQVTEIEIIKETKSNSSKVSTLEMWAEEVVAFDGRLSFLLKAVNNAQCFKGC